MKIAIPCENGQVFQHFGHTETFKIYTVEANILTMSDTISTNGSGHGALAALLQKSGVTDLICGGIGAGAKQALATANINLYGGVTGDVNVAAQALLAGTLSYDSNITCSHHGNDHDHNEDHECRHGQCS
jgi:predicted Fe-Mo cluster-binding NifX family protein